MRITIGNTDGKAYGLNASEACVLAVIEKCSKGESAKGWYGSMLTLAEALPMKINRMTVARAVSRLLELGLIREEGKCLYSNAQNVQNDAQNVQSDAQNVQEYAQFVLPPYPPIYKEEENNKGYNARTITRDAWVALKKEFYIFWAQAKPAAKFNDRYKSCEKLWASKSETERKQILAAVKEQPLDAETNPWKYIANFAAREPEPTNYNRSSLTPPAPIKPACYKGEWGMYTQQDIDLFHLKTKDKNGVQ